MILIYGQMADPPLSSTVEALQEAGIEYILLEQAVLDQATLHVDAGPGGVSGTLVAAGQKIPLESLHSVYARPLELPRNRWSTTDTRHARALHEQLFEWLDVSPALVVNRPRAMQANGSKPLQIQLIAEAGFQVPETLVTSSSEEVRNFWQRHGRVVYKSASGVRSIVQELDEHSAARLDKLSALPAQFQELVPGVDVRVHVVGDLAFAAEIVGTGIDYRYSGRQGGHTTLAATELPLELVQRCVSLSRNMGLPLSGIDLRRRPDGRYVCFEVNPMPAYSYFEAHTGLPISRALCELLVKGVTEPIEVFDVPGYRESHPSCRDDRCSPAVSTAG